MLWDPSGLSGCGFFGLAPHCFAEAVRGVGQAASDTVGSVAAFGQFAWQYEADLELADAVDHAIGQGVTRCISEVSTCARRAFDYATEQLQKCRRDINDAQNGTRFCLKAIAGIALWQLRGLRAVDASATLARAAKAVGRLDPAEIRFSQDSISATFRNGRGSIDELAEGLRSRRIDPSDVPAVRLVKRDGNLFTLDNRRLEAFRRAGVDIPYRMATPEEIAAEAYKFTTRNGGTSVRVRGG